MGIKSKIDYLRLEVKAKDPDIIFIAEAEICIDDINLVKIDRYEIEIIERTSKSRVLCYVRSGLNHKRLQTTDINLDVIAIEVKNVRYIGIYKGFKLQGFDSQTAHLHKLIKELEQLSNTTKKLIIGGDFNIDLLKPSSGLNELEKWSFTRGLTQLVTENTRRRVVNVNGLIRVEESAIDHVYTDLENMQLIQSFSVSDHDFLMVKSHQYTNQATKKIKKLVRDWRDYDKIMVEAIISDKMETTQISSHDELNSLLNDTLDEIAPLRVIRIKETSIISTKVESLKKRRDRFLKKYKKSGNPEHLIKAKSFTATLKKSVKKETKRMLQCKAKSNNPKDFWKAVNIALGKVNLSSSLTIRENDHIIDNKSELAEKFGAFFLNKVISLSCHNVDLIKLNKPEHPLTFSFEQVKMANKSLSNKRSYGIDGIPQNLLKDGAELLCENYRQLVNRFCANGLPDELKTARVIPLHKKGSKQEMTNYRPISNLSSLSKLYEKCILSRLNDELKDHEGLHQHGFRQNHSTETALLQLQGMIAETLDTNSSGIVYSVDLSAAFDLLMPDKFYYLFKDKISEGLLYCLMDFLQNRKFIIDIDGTKSNVFNLDRGCVQGSILGPKLFTLYLGELQHKLGPNSNLVSYADDTYVLVSGNSEQEVINNTEVTLKKHIDYLKEMGMVVNESKTESMWIGPSEPSKDSIRVNGTVCKFSNNIKALGIYLDKDLSWDKQAEFVINKGKSLLSHFKFLRKYFNEQQYLKIVSGNYYGAVFYACTVWFDKMKTIHKTKLNAMHFRMLRVACRDYKHEISKDELMTRCKRATPIQWVRFLTSSKAIKIARNKEPPDLYDSLMSTCYTEPRKPDIGYFYDNSKRKHGKQIFHNRLEIMKEIDFPWLNRIITDDEIRIEMKKTFFKF